MADTNYEAYFRRPTSKTKDIVITHEDEKGNVTKENRTIQEKVPVVLNQDNSSFSTVLAAKLGMPIYQLKSGKYTDNLFDAPTTIELDKDTGDIKISAPDEILNQDWFKEKYVNNSNLIKLSEVYKSNPDYAYETQDENGNTVYKKAEELIQDYSDNINKDIEQLNALYTARLSLLPKYGNKIANMTPDDMRIAFYTPYNIGDYKAKDSDAIYIPTQLLNNSKFGRMIRNLDTFNKDTRTVQRKDFIDNFWNRGNTKLTPEELQQIYQNMGTDLTYSSWTNVDENDYEYHGSNEAAREIQFRNFMMAEDPKREWNDNVWDTVTGAIQGVARGIGDLGISFASVIEMGGDVLTGTRRDSDINPSIAEQWEDWKSYNDEQLDLISDVSETVTGISEFATELAENIYLGNVAAGAVGKIAASAERFAVAKNLISSESGVGKMVGAYVAALNDSKDAGEIIKSAIGAQKVMATTGKMAGTIVNISTQAIIDATLSDPVLYRKAIMGEGGEEANKYLTEQAAWNFGGWAVGLGLEKILLKMSGTKFGRVLNAVLSQNIAKLKVKGYDISDSLRAMIGRRSLTDQIEAAITKVDPNDVDKIILEGVEVSKYSNKADLTNAQKLRTLSQLETVRKETKALADADLHIFENLKINDDMLEEAETLVNNIKKAQVAINIENMKLKIFKDQYDDIKINPALAGKNDEIVALESKITQLDRKMISERPDVKLTRVAGTKFAQEESNYIGVKHTLSNMEIVEKNPGSFSETTVANVKRNIESYRQELAKYDEMFTDELKSALDEYAVKTQEWYSLMNEYRRSKGIFNSEDLDELLSNPLFEQGNYMRVQRLQDPSYLKVRNTDGTKRVNIAPDTQSLSFGPVSDFMAPDLVRENYKFSTALKERNTTVLRIRSSLNGSTTRTVVEGEQTQFEKRFYKTKREAQKATDAYIDNALSNSKIDPSDIRDRYNEWLKNMSDVSAANKEVNKQQRALDRVAEKKYRVNSSDRSLAVSTLSPTEISNRLIQGGKSTSGSILRDGLILYGDDPVAFKKWYDSLPDEGKSFINSVRRDYNTYVGPLSGGDYRRMYSNTDLNVKPSETNAITKGNNIKTLESLEDELDLRGIYVGKNASRDLMGTSDDERLAEIFRKKGIGKKGGGINWNRLTSEEREEVFEILSKRDDVKDLIKDHRLRYDPEDAISEKQLGLLDQNRDVQAMPRMSAEHLETLIASDDNLENTFNTIFLKNDKDLMKSKEIDDLVIENKRANDKFVKEFYLAEDTKKLQALVGDDAAERFTDDVVDFVNSTIDDTVKGIMDNPKTAQHIKVLAKESGCSYEDAARYYALYALDNNKDKIFKQIKNSFGSSDDIGKQLYRQTTNAYNSIVESELNNARLVLGETNEIVNGEIFDKAKQLRKEIEGADAAAKNPYSNMIMTTDQYGRKVYMETDPVTAYLAKTEIDYSNDVSTGIEKVNKLASKTFRFGTTMANLGATLRQWFRDPLNAFVSAGPMRTIKANSKELVEDLGQRIVDQLDNFDYKQLADYAEKTDKDIRQLAVERELQLGKSMAGQTTESALYRESLRSDKKLTKMKEGAQKAYDKVNWIMNEGRETYLRNLVYTNAMSDGLKKGMTLEQARLTSQFLMNNATTDFSRKLVHLQRIADSTPYFSAAINGTKSFWRLASLDPVGVSTRIMAGLVIPQMYLTASTLGDKENREVYKNLPEWQKSENLVFVQNGTPITIPIPQELAAIVDPFRQFVEGLYGANKNNFWELAANDIVGFSPIELSGFTAVDLDNLVSDPTIFDRLGRGFSKLFSQVAPVPIKTAYIAATGIDPYTGKNIRDNTYKFWNEDTQSYELSDGTQSAFMEGIANVFGLDLNPRVGEKILSGVIGNTGMDVVDFLASIVQKITGDESADPLGELVGSQLDQAGGSLTGVDYNMLQSAWSNTIAALENERDGILASKQMDAINRQLATESNPETRKRLLSQRHDMLADWEKKAKSAVDGLIKRGGTLDKNKYAAVVQLFNMNQNPNWAVDNQYLQDLSKDNYYAGSNEAYKTLQRIGIDGATDVSVFGYVTYNRDGEAIFKYNSPTAIVNAGNILLNNSKVVNANVDAIIKKNDLYTKHSDFNAQIKAIYNKGKLSQSDYNKIDAIKIQFNTELMAALAPYLENVTPEAVINNSDAMDTLAKLIMVPSAYEKVKGRYVSSGGGKLNLNQGFARSYIKNIYKESK